MFLSIWKQDPMPGGRRGAAASDVFHHQNESYNVNKLRAVYGSSFLSPLLLRYLLGQIMSPHA